MFRPLAHLLPHPSQLAICLAFGFAGAALAEEPAAVPFEVKGAEFQLILGGAESRPASGYYIGIACEPISKELAQKLKLEAGRGLLIETILPNSPAAKAGLKSDDVIVAHGDKLLATTEQLVEAVAQTKDGVLKLIILRGGEKQVIEVRPAKRQAEGRFTVVPEEDEKSDKVREQLQKQLEALRKAAEGKGMTLGPQPPKPVAPLPAPPGASMPGGMMPGATPRMGVATAAARSLPDDMKVTVHKQGQKPATIVVEQGQKLWKTTEKELEMLPSEARGYVAHLLGRPEGDHRIRMMMPGMGGSSGMAPGGMTPGSSGGASGFGASGTGAGGVPMHFELKLQEPEGKNPAEGKPGPAPVIKQLPGGGLQIEIRETEEKKPAAKPAETKAEGARVIRQSDGRIEIELSEPDVKRPGFPPSVKWLELKRAETKPSELPAPKKPETELRELEQKVRELRRQLEELRKEAGERR